jgi:UDP-N-acetylmuramoylalanine--D-glutamate ligase
MGRHSGQHVVVLGAGVTGLSLARWLTREGAIVTVADTREAPPQAEALRLKLPEVKLSTGPFEASLFARADLIAISPGVPQETPALQGALSRGLPLVGDIELFARVVPKDVPVIAITGSNGKTTVTTLVGELCRAGGLSALVAGNIGTPVLDALAEIEASGSWPQVIVLELSSFQLETAVSLRPVAATVLNVSEDHLDRYSSLEAYAEAKARIFAGNAIQVLNRDDPRVMAMARAGRTHYTFGVSAPRGSREWGLRERDGKSWLSRGMDDLCAAEALTLVGRHNALNALAALALVTPLSLPQGPVLDALRGFRGLPHRVEPIGQHRDVLYIDDSKGTNVGATIAALEGLGRPVVLIAGGDGKGQDFSPLRSVIETTCRAVVLIGRDAMRIDRVLDGVNLPRAHAATLPDAVKISRALAKPGDAVLLSPACASFDMFRDYLHRSEVFAAAVRGLSRAKSKDEAQSDA